MLVNFITTRLRLQILLYTILVLTIIFLINDINDNSLKIFLGINQNQKTANIVYEFITPTPTLSPTPTPTLSPTPVPKMAPAETLTNTNKPSGWGVATQVGEHTYTMKVGEDSKMANQQEILNALNAYRNNHGSGSLSWNDNLTNFAQDRANSFSENNKLDEHAGFYSYLNNQENFAKLGFSSIGENSSIGYKIEAVHLIEWVYSADEGHNQNQLNKKWSHVGIGVNGTATDLIFGGN